MTKVLTWVWLLCLLAAVLIGVPSRYTHHVQWAPARALFVPCGVALLLHAGLVWRQRRDMAAWMAAGGLAAIGLGMHKLMHGPWTLLAVPVLVAASAAQVRALVVGPSDPWFAQLMRARRGRAKAGTSDKRVRTQAYALVAGTFVLLVTGIVLSVSAA